MNLNQVLKHGIAFLGAKENAVLDAEVLLAFVVGETREYLFSHCNEVIDPCLLAVYDKYLSRALSGEPIAYIIGEKEFYGLSFFVDNRVLVPRPETELMVEKVLDFLKIESDKAGDYKYFKILDVGTGSCNISVSIAKTFFHDLGVVEIIDAVDIDTDAIDVAKINVLQHNVEDKVHVFHSDLLEFLEEGFSYDVIVANLPYIGTKVNNFISADAEKFEPKVALFGGEDGLELYKKMFQQIADKKVGFNMLLGEFCYGQGEYMRSLLSKYFDQRWSIEKDLAGIERMFVVR